MCDSTSEKEHDSRTEQNGTERHRKVAAGLPTFVSTLKNAETKGVVKFNIVSVDEHSWTQRVVQPPSCAEMAGAQRIAQLYERSLVLLYRLRHGSAVCVAHHRSSGLNKKTHQSTDRMTRSMAVRRRHQDQCPRPQIGLRELQLRQCAQLNVPCAQLHWIEIAGLTLTVDVRAFTCLERWFRLRDSLGRTIVGFTLAICLKRQELDYWNVLDTIITMITARRS